MKRYNYKDGTGYVMVGEAREMKAVERTLYKHWNNDTSPFMPMFYGHPKFNLECVYAIDVDTVDYTYSILTADTFCRLLLNNLFVKMTKE